MKKESPDSHFVVHDSVSIEDALRAITMNRRGAVIVVDQKERVVGVASDGDIRRALVRGVNVMAPVKKAMNLNPVFVKKGSAGDKEPKTFFKTHPNITLLPVVTQNFALSHLYKLPDAKTS
jgi:CBS domain-containing protein